MYKILGVNDEVSDKLVLVLGTRSFCLILHRLSQLLHSIIALGLPISGDIK